MATDSGVSVSHPIGKTDEYTRLARRYAGGDKVWTVSSQCEKRVRCGVPYLDGGVRSNCGIGFYNNIDDHHDNYYRNRRKEHESKKTPEQEAANAKRVSRMCSAPLYTNIAGGLCLVSSSVLVRVALDVQS